MGHKEFFDKVVAMRKAQKEYFKTRLPSALQKSKQLEAEIDTEIKRGKTYWQKGRMPGKLLCLGNLTDLINRVDND